MRQASLLFCFICTLFSLDLIAQSFQGRIVDAETGQALPFATIRYNQAETGSTTDLEGRFRLPENQKIYSITPSYVGYQSIFISLDSVTWPLLIALEKDNITLKEVVFKAGENPADRIIREAIRRKSENIPDGLDAYFFQSHHRLVLTMPGPEEEKWRKNIPKSKNILKTVQGMDEYLAEKHLLYSETLSDIYVRKGLGKREKIRAHQTSGFKHPALASIPGAFHEFSFLDTEIDLLGQKYLSPYSSQGRSAYRFYLEERIFRSTDTLYVISFYPKTKNGYADLQGQLWIESANYALTQGTAQLQDSEFIAFDLMQGFEKHFGKWFSHSYKTEMVLKKYLINHLPVKVLSVAAMENFGLERPSAIKGIAGSVDFSPNALEQPSSYWLEHALLPMEEKSERTIVFLDSAIGRQQKLIHGIFDAALFGAIPWGKWEIPLQDLMAFNEYEGYRLGLGIRSSPRLMQRVSFGGNAAYGFRDKAFKYGGFTEFTLWPAWDLKLRMHYQQDVQETGQFGPRDHLLLLNDPPLSYRRLFSQRMDSLERLQISLRFSPAASWHIGLERNIQTFNPTYDYSYLSRASELSQGPFQWNEWRLLIDYRAGQQVAQWTGRKYMLRSGLPQLQMSLAYGEESSLRENYLSLKAQIKKEWNLGLLGRQYWQMSGGQTWGRPGLHQLWWGPSIQSANFGIYVRDFFHTMGVYEFLSSRQASFFLEHDFGKLTRKTKWQPGLMLTHNLLVGDMAFDHIQDVSFQTVNRPFLEAGMVVKDLLSINYVNLAYMGFGIGAFYRYGTHAFPEWQENLALKLLIRVSF